jgi:hypothetical protein
MNQTNTVIVAIFVALGVMLVAGLVVITTMQNVQAQARSCVKYNKGEGIEESCFRTHSDCKNFEASLVREGATIIKRCG